MAKNGYVTTREFDASITRIESTVNRIDSKLDNLDVRFTALKTKFNDELEETVNKERFKTSVIVASISIALSVGIRVVFGW